ncbi:hypothetical protein [Pararhodospirillum photometricum]|uniref:hypothetical protein n=1 Tax=Pararhodospirillum photometricum TaxID=1084 RepID=UPI0005A1452A|nr:hypothetical protein [Pararhodospirillum photometricum]
MSVPTSVHFVFDPLAAVVVDIALWGETYTQAGDNDSQTEIGLIWVSGSLEVACWAGTKHRRDPQGQSASVPGVGDAIDPGLPRRGATLRLDDLDLDDAGAIASFICFVGDTQPYVYIPDHRDPAVTWRWGGLYRLSSVTESTTTERGRVALDLQLSEATI